MLKKIKTGVLFLAVSLGATEEKEHLFGCNCNREERNLLILFLHVDFWCEDHNGQSAMPDYIFK